MSEFKAGDIVKFTKYVSGYGDITIDKEYVLYEAESNWENGLFILDDVTDTNFFPRDFPQFMVLVPAINKRPHYDLRIAHANGSDIEVRDYDEQDWVLCEEPDWNPSLQYRIAVPKAPERVFPVTSLTDDELIAVYCTEDRGQSVGAYRAIANAAIKRYLEEYEDE